MIINTPTGTIDTNRPCKCSGCRRMFVGPNKPGSLTISNGKINFICYQCKPKEKKIDVILPDDPSNRGVPPQSTSAPEANQAVAAVVGQASPLNG